MKSFTVAALLHETGLGGRAAELTRLLPDPLFPHQYRFLSEGGLLAGASALCVAPTGSGKSALADGAAVRHLAAGRVVVHLAPTRALAAERAEALEALFGPMGYRVALSTREERAADDDIKGGRVDIVVAVYEKAQTLFLHAPGLRRAAGLIVADEIQIARDPVRGPLIDLLLRLWRLQGKGPQILALTSAMEAPEAFAAEHGLAVLSETRRPVPLQVGRIDLARGTACWECEETGEAGSRHLESGYGSLEEFEERIGEFSGQFEGPVVVFVPTRRQARRLARALADQRSPRVECAGREFGDDHTELPALLERGVAYHSAELTRSQRRAVEDSFRAGEVDWCFSTTTLAEGVNLSARTVLVLSPDGGFPAPLGNLFGRAGRPGQAVGTAYEVRFRWDYRGAPTPQWRVPDEEGLLATAMELAAFALRACMPPLSREGVLRTVGAAATRLPMRAALERGLRWGFWAEEEENGLRLLPAGELLAGGGIEPAVVCGWRTILRRFPGAGGGAANLFLALGSAPRIQRAAALSRDERLSTHWILELRRHLESDGSPLAGYFADYLQEPDHLPRTTHEAAKAACLLLELRDCGDAAGLAERVSLPAGVLEEIAQTASFLLHQLGQLSQALGGTALAPLPAVSAREGEGVRIIPIHRDAGGPALVLRRGGGGIIRFRGRQVRLTPIQYRLLELLALCAGEVVPYERVQAYVWPDAVVERQQVSYHKSNIEKRIREVSGLDGPLIETHSCFGMRLLLPPEEVVVEQGSLLPCLEEEAEPLFNSVADEVCL